MSADADDAHDDHIGDDEEEYFASTGAAADSAESDETLKALPRLLRYALITIQNEMFVPERLVGEIAELVPNLPMTLTWAMGQFRPEDGLALAAELDHLAVTLDKTDLRSLADAVRLLWLPLPVTAGSYDLDYVRVAKALLQALGQVPISTGHDVAAKIEAFCAGWAALPMAKDMLPPHRAPTAAANATHLGRKLSRHRVAAIEAAMQKQFDDERREHKQDAQVEAEASPAGLVPPDHIVVCSLDELAMKNGKLKEVIAPLKAIVNTAIPLVVVPPLHVVRQKLLFEFPYAATVIDFVLADLVGRRTVLLRPVILHGRPGGGKSRFCRTLGLLLNITTWRTDASRADGAGFGGTDKRWYSAEPAHPLLAIAQGKHANPLVMIDEVEKAGTRADYGRFWDVLLGFLEPETAARYPDPALQTNLDLSHVSYIATANTLDPLPSPLRDRFRMIAFPEPTADDLDALLPAVVADLAAEQGLDSRWVEPLTGLERDAAAAHWQGGSVRRLRRIIEILLRSRDKKVVPN